MKNTKFMTAKEKELVLKAWKRFLGKGLRWEDFTERLYRHLINNCSFIAHYDRSGFYVTYFESGDQIVLFLSQFDARNNDPADGVPLSIEYGMTHWAADKHDNEYADINQAMIKAAVPYIDGLLQKAREAQRIEDIQEAKRLLAKHNLTLKPKKNDDAQSH